MCLISLDADFFICPSNVANFRQVWLEAKCNASEAPGKRHQVNGVGVTSQYCSVR